jgi:hypothetical protein
LVGFTTTNFYNRDLFCQLTVSQSVKDSEVSEAYLFDSSSKKSYGKTGRNY